MLYCFSLGLKFTYSGVTLDPANATMVTTTIIVVLFTTLVCKRILLNDFFFTHVCKKSLRPICMVVNCKPYHLPPFLSYQEEQFVWFCIINTAL